MTSRYHIAVRRTWLLGLLLGLTGGDTTAAERWRIAPPATWVTPAERPEAPAKDDAAGVRYLLVDHQAQVAPAGISHYWRYARKVVSSSGLADAAEIRLAWEPSYQELVVHHVELIRDGRVIGTFGREDVRVLQQESELDQRLYNGALTAVIQLKDVRKGDVIDYAYTIAGENPIFEGRFSDNLSLGYSVPVTHVRHRILWPRSRTLNHKGHRTTLAPRIDEEGDRRVYTWEVRDVPAIADEDSTPEWEETYPWVQVSEFTSWAEVARWAARLFASQRQGSPDLARLVETWRSLPDEERRARAAVRMVQDEIRYLGIEIGPNSHQPHPPPQVLAQRFGDCKDKALLLSVILGDLGVPAVPALVNTRTRRGLDDWLPTPFAFDHAILRARVGGRDVWIDATRTHQGGALSSLVAPSFERALLVDAAASALVPIPIERPKEPTVVIEESYTLPKGDAPGRLAVRTSYQGLEADRMRSWIDSESKADRSKAYLNYYASTDAKVRALHDPTFADDREANRVAVAEDYEIPGFWKDDGGRWFEAWRIDDELRRPSTTQRTRPLLVNDPVFVRHRLRLQGPDLPRRIPDPLTIKAGAFEFTRKSERADGAVVLTYDYRSTRDVVPADAVPEHLKNIAAVDDAVDYYVDADALVAGGGPPRALRWLAFAIIAAVVGFALVGMVQVNRLSRRRQAFAGRVAPMAGAAPDRALPVADIPALEARLAAAPCRCGRAFNAPAERSSFTYDGRPMTVTSRRCDGCGAEEAVYFDVAASSR